MSRGRGHIFDDLSKLNEMLQLRRQGVSTVRLGAHYGVDHSTIVYHSKRYEVKPPKGVRMEVFSVNTAVGPVIARRPAIIIANTAPRVITDFDGTVLNPGKTYAEYMAITKERERMRRIGKPLLPESK